jgi:hypothetical protein
MMQFVKHDGPKRPFGYGNDSFSTRSIHNPGYTLRPERCTTGTSAAIWLLLSTNLYNDAHWKPRQHGPHIVFNRYGHFVDRTALRIRDAWPN